jgi:hypothetical protein
MSFCVPESKAGCRPLAVTVWGCADRLIQVTRVPRRMVIVCGWNTNSFAPE